MATNVDDYEHGKVAAIDKIVNNIINDKKVSLDTPLDFTGTDETLHPIPSSKYDTLSATYTYDFKDWSYYQNNGGGHNDCLIISMLTLTSPRFRKLSSKNRDLVARYFRTTVLPDKLKELYDNWKKNDDYSALLEVLDNTIVKLRELANELGITNVSDNNAIKGAIVNYMMSHIPDDTKKIFDDTIKESLLENIKSSLKLEDYWLTIIGFYFNIRFATIVFGKRNQIPGVIKGPDEEKYVIIKVLRPQYEATLDHISDPVFIIVNDYSSHFNALKPPNDLFTINPTESLLQHTEDKPTCDFTEGDTVVYNNHLFIVHARRFPDGTIECNELTLELLKGYEYGSFTIPKTNFNVPIADVRHATDKEINTRKVDIIPGPSTPPPGPSTPPPGPSTPPPGPSTPPPGPSTPPPVPPPVPTTIHEIIKRDIQQISGPTSAALLIPRDDLTTNKKPFILFLDHTDANDIKCDSCKVEDKCYSESELLRYFNEKATTNEWDIELYVPLSNKTLGPLFNTTFGTDIKRNFSNVTKTDISASKPTSSGTVFLYKLINFLDKIIKTQKITSANFNELKEGYEDDYLDYVGEYNTIMSTTISDNYFKKFMASKLFTTLDAYIELQKITSANFKEIILKNIFERYKALYNTHKTKIDNDLLSVKEPMKQLFELLVGEFKEKELTPEDVTNYTKILLVMDKHILLQQINALYTISKIFSKSTKPAIIFSTQHNNNAIREILRGLYDIKIYWKNIKESSTCLTQTDPPQYVIPEPVLLPKPPADLLPPGTPKPPVSSVPLPPQIVYKSSFELLVQAAKLLVGMATTLVHLRARTITPESGTPLTPGPAKPLTPVKTPAPGSASGTPGSASGTPAPLTVNPSRFGVWNPFKQISFPKTNSTLKPATTLPYSLFIVQHDNSDKIWKIWVLPEHKLPQSKDGKQSKSELLKEITENIKKEEDFIRLDNSTFYVEINTDASPKPASEPEPKPEPKPELKPASEPTAGGGPSSPFNIEENGSWVPIVELRTWLDGKGRSVDPKRKLRTDLDKLIRVLGITIIREALQKREIPEWVKDLLGEEFVNRAKGKTCQHHGFLPYDCEETQLLNHILAADQFAVEQGIDPGDSKIEEFKKLMDEYANNKTDAERKIEIEKQLERNYPDAAITVKQPGPGGLEEKRIVRNPYRAYAERHSESVSFANPAGINDASSNVIPGLKQNSELLNALVPEKILKDQQMSIALLESLWFCGKNPELRDDPRCYPLRMLGEVREYMDDQNQLGNMEAMKSYIDEWDKIKKLLDATIKGIGVTKGPKEVRFADEPRFKWGDHNESVIIIKTGGTQIELKELDCFTFKQDNADKFAKVVGINSDTKTSIPTEIEYKLWDVNKYNEEKQTIKNSDKEIVNSIVKEECKDDSITLKGGVKLSKGGCFEFTQDGKKKYAKVIDLDIANKNINYWLWNPEHYRYELNPGITPRRQPYKISQTDLENLPELKITDCKKSTITTSTGQVIEYDKCFTLKEDGKDKHCKIIGFKYENEADKFPNKIQYSVWDDKHTKYVTSDPVLELLINDTSLQMKEKCIVSGSSSYNLPTRVKATTK